MAVQNLKRVFGHISPAFAIGITHGRYGGDFVMMSACAIANAVDHRSDVQKLREDSYLETVKRYSKEEIEQLCELLAVTVSAFGRKSGAGFSWKPLYET